MLGARLADELEHYIDPSWPPMAHVRRGAQRLGPEGRALVSQRLRDTLGTFQPPPKGKEAALRRFCSFLSQVEVIAIEVPLSALPHATAETKPLLERQLADEVFHALIFASVAKRLGGLDHPIAEAETLLDQIRRQEDPKTTAVLLNLLAEGWIENLFDHAAQWGVADALFRIVLEDEARHVEEAMDHAAGVDLAHVEQAVRAFEDELFRLVQHPRVLLPTLALAGERRFRELGQSFLEVHKRALAEVNLRPADAVSQIEATYAEFAQDLGGDEPQRASRIEPESQWRRTALELWDTPRSPAMSGWTEIRVDHIPRRLLTPVLIAAVGKVWAEYPRVNRYTLGGEVYKPATINVGVRVQLGAKGEALSTVPVLEADARSIGDIRRILTESVKRMNELGAQVEGLVPDEGTEALSAILEDEELMSMVPPETVVCPVTVSNVGKTGLHAGFGALPGALGQSVEIILGRVEKRPVWKVWRYKPADCVTIGATADHRVIDGPHAGEALRRIELALSPEGVKEILARPDTLVDEKLPARLFAAQERTALLLSCKAPFWLGWLCWLFKK